MRDTQATSLLCTGRERERIQKCIVGMYVRVCMQKWDDAMCRINSWFTWPRLYACIYAMYTYYYIHRPPRPHKFSFPLLYVKNKSNIHTTMYAKYIVIYADLLLLFVNITTMSESVLSREGDDMWFRRTGSKLRVSRMSDERLITPGKAALNRWTAICWRSDAKCSNERLAERSRVWFKPIMSGIRKAMRCYMRNAS